MPTDDEITPPTVGSAAPDVQLRDANGADVRLSSLWERPPGGLTLVFLRHFG